MHNRIPSEGHLFQILVFPGEKSQKFKFTPSQTSYVSIVHAMTLDERWSILECKISKYSLTLETNDLTGSRVKTKYLLCFSFKIHWNSKLYEIGEIKKLRNKHFFQL